MKHIIFTKSRRNGMSAFNIQWQEALIFRFLYNNDWNYRQYVNRKRFINSRKKTK